MRQHPQAPCCLHNSGLVRKWMRLLFGLLEPTDQDDENCCPSSAERAGEGRQGVEGRLVGVLGMGQGFGVWLADAEREQQAQCRKLHCDGTVNSLPIDLSKS